MAESEVHREPHRQAAATPSGGVTGARPARALGRGLEDLSHLFHPRRTENGPVAEPGSAPKVDNRLVSPKDRSGLMLLRPAGRLTRSQVIAVIQEPWGAIDEQFHAIDSSVPCSSCGVIDVLGIDAANRLVVVDVDSFTADGLLLRGLGHMEWLVRNAANVRRMYPGRTIDFDASPRLVLVAPRFSVAIRHAVSQISESEIACVRYQGLDVSGWTGIFFEPVTDDGR